MMKLAPRARSVYMGHKIQDLDGGAAITESTYTVRRKGVKHLLVVAETMTTLIEKSIVSLVSSGTCRRRLLPTSTCLDSDQRDRALQVLDAAGLVEAIDVEGEEVVEVALAAELLGLPKRAVRTFRSRGRSKPSARHRRGP